MDAANLYRTAAPLFIGIIVMGLPSEFFITLPPLLRPLLGNGLLVGILLALALNQVRSRPHLSAMSPNLRAKGDQR
jgi:xanthine/uracil permease